MGTVGAAGALREEGDVATGGLALQGVSVLPPPSSRATGANDPVSLCLSFRTCTVGIRIVPASRASVHGARTHLCSVNTSYCYD